MYVCMYVCSVNIFTARRYASVLHALCLSLCVCLHLSQVGLLLKRLSLSSCKYLMVFGRWHGVSSQEYKVIWAYIYAYDLKWP